MSTNQIHGPISQPKKYSICKFPSTQSLVPRYLVPCLLVEGGGFEPPKVEPADLQSAPFGHSGTPPKIKPRILREHSTTVNRNDLIRHKKNGAGGRNRTPDLLITNQLLYQLSYTSIFIQNLLHWRSGSCPRFALTDPGPASCRSFVGLRMSTGHSVPPHPKSYDDDISQNPLRRRSGSCPRIT